MFKSLFLAATLIGSGISLDAQNVTPAPAKPAQAKTQKKALTPEDRTVRVIRMMTAKTNLTDAQFADAKQIILERENTIEETRKSTAGKDKKAAIDAARTKADSKLQGVLTPEQWKLWLTFKAEQQKRHHEKKAAKTQPASSTNPADQEDFY